MQLLGGSSRIQLCGGFQVTLRGADVVPDSRQARLLLAYLVLNRDRAVDRRELMDVLWPPSAQLDRRAALRPLLSRLRHAFGPDREAIRGRRAVALVLPDDVAIDVEEAVRDTAAAEAALAGGRAREAFRLAERAAATSARRLLPGDDAPWVDAKRLDLDDLHGRALECLAAAGVTLGGAALGAAEGAARSLIERAPFSESSYRLLMQVHTARGDVAEAVLVYELLRQLLRDELGLAPGKQAQSLHRDLLVQAPDS